MIYDCCRQLLLTDFILTDRICPNFFDKHLAVADLFGEAPLTDGHQLFEWHFDRRHRVGSVGRAIIAKKVWRHALELLLWHFLLNHLLCFPKEVYLLDLKFLRAPLLSQLELLLLLLELCQLHEVVRSRILMLALRNREDLVELLDLAADSNFLRASCRHQWCLWYVWPR